MRESGVGFDLQQSWFTADAPFRSKHPTSQGSENASVLPRLRDAAPANSGNRQDDILLWAIRELQGGANVAHRNLCHLRRLEDTLLRERCKHSLALCFIVGQPAFTQRLVHHRSPCCRAEDIRVTTLDGGFTGPLLAAQRDCGVGQH